MSDLKHTQGPFFLAQTSLSSLPVSMKTLTGLQKVLVIAAPSEPLPTPIALVFVPPRDHRKFDAVNEEFMANADVLAAGPGLFQACVELLRQSEKIALGFPVSSDELAAARGRARGAIAKARGVAK